MLPSVCEVKTAPRPPEAQERSSYGGTEGFRGIETVLNWEVWRGR